MENIPLTEILKLGTNGITLMLVWSLIKTNEKLLTEINQYNDLLLDIINRLLEIEGKRGMTRREDREN
ncbi:MAG: hypothetical protein ACOVOV_02910 [Dolichospermum sp.]